MGGLVMKKKGNTVFALDIGTRSIVGLLMEENEKGINLNNIVVKEHSSRSMLDGQIHNIPQVSALVKEVKVELEKSSGKRLKNVAVAAAGRSLKTVKTKVFHKYINQETITYEDVLKLELKGAQKAQAILVNKHNSEGASNYYCVGYSIIEYFLDESKIGSLIGQKGNKIGLEIVAAFLPKVVVESLQTVLADNKLKLANITLEPIAAINAILPPAMRKLNLALVDVGAGTSDIAISDDGSIIAYGMVPVAGDEITEELCEKYLLDFNQGEQLKRKLYDSKNKNVDFKDILGFDHSLTSEEIIESLSQTVELLAKKISAEIIKLNNKPPQAVILIGGGSLTPLLTEHLAELLGLSKQRVAVQRASSIKEVINVPEKFQGPEIVTPLGIGLTALKHVTLGFIPVQVNNFNINLLNLGNNTVSDALLAAGIDTNKLYGRPGLAQTVEVNGKLRVFPGTIGEKAVVKINGNKASLNTILKPKDKIEFISAKDGERGRGIIRDLLPSKNIVIINNETKEFPFEVTMDGKIVSYNQEIKDGSKIFIREITQLGELLEYWKIVDLTRMIKITLIHNHKKEILTLKPFEIIRNGKVLSLFDNIRPQDQLLITEKSNEEFIVKKIIKQYLNIRDEMNFRVTVNDETIEIPMMDLKVRVNEKKVNMNYSVNDGDILEVDYSQNINPILADILPRINFSYTPPSGKVRLEMLVNGKEAQYTTPLKNEDNINLNWK